MTCLKILFGQSFVEQHALPRGLESHLLVAIPALPLSVSRVTLPCNQVVVVVVVVVVDVVVFVVVVVLLSSLLLLLLLLLSFLLSSPWNDEKSQQQF